MAEVIDLAEKAKLGMNVVPLRGFPFKAPNLNN